MRLVLRIAGSLLESENTLRVLAGQIVALADEGHQLLLIHGGERLLTATLKQIGINSQFESGLRIVDRKTRDVAKIVLFDVLTRRLVSAISAKRQPVISIPPHNRDCFQAEPVVRNEIRGLLGYVGYLSAICESFLASHWQKGVVLTAAPFGIGADNEIYCINADHMAAACAEYLGADQLVYLVKTQGILKGEKLLPSVGCEEIDSLTYSAFLSVDMVLKLESAKRALEGGVGSVRIINGMLPTALLRAVAAEPVGTAIIHQHSLSHWDFARISAMNTESRRESMMNSPIFARGT